MCGGSAFAEKLVNQENNRELVTHFMLPCLQLFSELGEHCSIYARQHFAGTWKMLFLEGQAK